MKNVIVLLVAASLLVAAQCNPGPKPPEPPPVVVVDAGPELDAGGGAPAVVDAGPDPLVTPGVRRACDNLALLKCAEGMNGCERVLQHVLDTQLVSVPLDCLVGADSKAGVHACGSFVACP